MSLHVTVPLNVGTRQPTTHELLQDRFAMQKQGPHSISWASETC